MDEHVKHIADKYGLPGEVEGEFVNHFKVPRIKSPGLFSIGNALSIRVVTPPTEINYFGWMFKTLITPSKMFLLHMKSIFRIPHLEFPKPIPVAEGTT
jgi:hypothetical protein